MLLITSCQTASIVVSLRDVDCLHVVWVLGPPLQHHIIRARLNLLGNCLIRSIDFFLCVIIDFWITLGNTSHLNIGLGRLLFVWLLV